MMATRFESLSPILAVDDLHQALAFYRDLLGFNLAWCWGEPPELAGICRDAVELTLMDRADKPKAAPASTCASPASTRCTPASSERAQPSSCRSAIGPTACAISGSSIRVGMNSTLAR